MSKAPGRRDQIVLVSRQLLEDDGPDALTMRAVAGAMDIKAPSLYKHVKSRHEIETLLSQQALIEIGAALDKAGPDLAKIGKSYRAWALANPALYELATSTPLDRENLEEGVESSAESALLEAVNSDRDRARACWAMAHGLVMLELSGRFPPDADIQAAWTSGLNAMSGR
ncbi:MAG: TetR/AcrR family transcriptional regulator [Solirubrobacterales bacterium]